MSSVVWTNTALTDVAGLVETLAQVNFDAADRAAKAIRSTGDSLELNPKRGMMVQDAPGVRRLLVPFGKYGFVMHYAILEAEVVILRVYHGRQQRPT
jgi:plasmid stabilization system protein ParE